MTVYEGPQITLNHSSEDTLEVYVGKTWTVIYLSNYNSEDHVREKIANFIDSCANDVAERAIDFLRMGDDDEWPFDEVGIHKEIR